MKTVHLPRVIYWSASLPLWYHIAACTKNQWVMLKCHKTRFFFLTRMHSSRMHTTHFSGHLYGGCLPLGPGDICLWVWGVSASWSRECLSNTPFSPPTPFHPPFQNTPFHHTPSQTPFHPLPFHHPLWTEWLTDRCKNITLSQTSFAHDKNYVICTMSVKDRHVNTMVEISCLRKPFWLRIESTSLVWLPSTHY